MSIVKGNALSEISKELGIIDRAVDAAKKKRFEVTDIKDSVKEYVSCLKEKQDEFEINEIEAFRRSYVEALKEESYNECLVDTLINEYSIEAHEAYLPRISECYDPIELSYEEFDSNKRIRYIELTKWISDSSDDILEKLINMYQVLDKEECNIALIYNRKKERCHVYLAVVNNKQDDLPKIANEFENRFVNALKGNFPGTEIKTRKNKNSVKGFGYGIVPCLELENLDEVSVAAVSNIAMEKLEDFDNQSIEKLLDGICPESDTQEYSIVLLATPQKDVLGKMVQLSELYSKLYPYSGWQLNRSVTSGISKGESGQVGYSEGGSINVTPFGVGASVNVGTNFSQGMNRGTSVSYGDGLNQSFVNHGVKYTLEVIEKQIKRLEEGTALGMWAFSAYVLSKDYNIVNNVSHMYLALTQGGDSYVSQASINKWKFKKNDYRAERIIESVSRLQHPRFELRMNRDENNQIVLKDEHNISMLSYPEEVDTSVLLTGRELARSLNFPQKSVCGLPIITSVSFGREVHKFDDQFDVSNDSDSDKEIKQIEIGRIYHMHNTEKSGVRIDLDSLTSHTFVAGSTGTGKTNSIFQLINRFCDNGIPFMVIEPAKGEYKYKVGGFDGCTVYGTNRSETNLFYINPFSFPIENVHVLEHIDRFVEILNACWPMYAAMPAVLKDSLELTYESKGWNLSNSVYVGESQQVVFPTFEDLLEILPSVLKDSMYSDDTKNDYAGALITRVKSLTNGLNGEILCSGKGIPDKDLFEKNVIIDLSRIGSTETKSLFMGLLVMKLQEYHLSMGSFDGNDDNLKHITIIEEAHNILRKTSVSQSQESANLQGKSVEMITNSIAEMRSFGEGFIIADQAPGLLDEAVIRNTNTKIVFRLPDNDDRMVTGKSIALKDEQIEEMAKLPRGVAAVYQNNWVEPVLCHFDVFDNSSEYKKPEKQIIDLNELKEGKELFFSHVFSGTGFGKLRDEDVDCIHKWIEYSHFGRETKKLMKEAALGGTLTQSQKSVLAYNVFEGKKISRILDDAPDSDVALKESGDYLLQRFINIDETVVQEIQILIIEAVERYNDTIGFGVKFRDILQRKG